MARTRPTVFHIEPTDEIIVPNGGQALIGRLIDLTHIRQRFNRLRTMGQKSPKFSNGDVALATIAMLSQGKTDYESITAYRADPFILDALGIRRLPSEATLRQRLGELGKLKDFALRIPREECVRLIAHFSDNLARYFDMWIPIDIDMTLLDNSNTKKEGVSWTYKNFEGYAPIIAYYGIEGFLINSELRPGRQHCQEGTPEFIRKTLRYAKSICDATPLVRLDSGNDAIENIAVIESEGADWIIKRNLRQESRGWWFDLARTEGRRDEPRPGKTVWRGRTEFDRDGRTLQVVYEVTERTSQADGQLFLIPEIEVSTWWTSLRMDADTVIRLYHEHATSEQFHAELKSEVGLERLPSQRFTTNELVLSLAGVAFNCLRLMGQIALWRGGKLPKSKRAPIRKLGDRRRLRSIMQDLMTMAVKLVHHARKWIMKIDRRNRWLGVWQDLYEFLLEQPVPT